MKRTALNCLIPFPVSVSLAGNGKFMLKGLNSVYAEPGLERYRTEISKMLSAFGIHVVAGDRKSKLRIGLQSALDREGWQIKVDENGIDIRGGAEPGIFYALQAFTQITSAASTAGPTTAGIEYGTVKDSPRFGWRGFMLDPARHFQSVKTVKQIIRMMAAFRLNVLHWHLTDNQGWRFNTGIVSRKASLDKLTGGRYTRKDLEEIAAYAKKYFIEIVPEVDVPGHSRGLIHAYPELACDPAHPGNEICLGNPNTLPFLKKIFAELMEVFAESRYIHFGGDEAELTHWEKCPLCQKAMKKGKFKSLRELENHFMYQLTRFALENGRIPVVWGTESTFPKDTVVQTTMDIREPEKHIRNGCKFIMSIHQSFYFDYPADMSEPDEPWMFMVPRESLYLADPYVIWEKQRKDFLLGPEACLWTEYVPEWRIIQKILPRLGAYAETTWSRPENKNWHDFLSREEYLRTSGYEDYLRSLG